MNSRCPGLEFRANASRIRRDLPCCAKVTDFHEFGQTRPSFPPHNASNSQLLPRFREPTCESAILSFVSSGQVSKGVPQLVPIELCGCFCPGSLDVRSFEHSLSLQMKELCLNTLP